MRVLVIAFLVFLLSSCAVYKPLNINNSEIEKQTSQIDTNAIKKIKNGDEILAKLENKQPLSLDKIASIALRLNPQLKIERDKIEIAKARLLGSKEIPNPGVSADVGFPVAGNIANTYDSYSIGLSYPIDWIFSHSSKVASARLDYESQKLNYDFIAYQVMQDAKIKAANIYYLEKILKEMDKRLKLYTDVYNTMKSAFDKKLISLSELEIAKNEFIAAKTQYLNTQNNLKNEKNALNKILGLPENVDVNVDVKTNNNFALPSLEKLYSNIPNRLDIVAFKLAYESQQKKTQEAFIKQFPKISINFPFSRDTSNVQTLGFGISIDFPIFNTNKAQIELEQVTQKNMYDEYVNRIVSAKFDIKKLLIDVENIQKQLKLLNSDLKNSIELLSYYNKAYTSGLISAIEYYKNVNSLIDKKIAIFNLEKNLFAAKLALEIASAQKLY